MSLIINLLLLLMKFGRGIKFNVFYTMLSKKVVTSLLLRNYDVITCSLVDDRSLKSIQVNLFLRNYSKYTFYRDVIYKFKLNRNILSLSRVLRLKTKNDVAEREHL